MYNYVFIAILIILIVIYIYLLYTRTFNISYFDCKIYQSKDGNEYCVKDPRIIETLDTINDKTIELLRYWKTNHSNNIINNILQRYNPDNLIESSPHNWRGDTSYTIGKGEILALCVKNKNNTIVDTNTLMYVMIHELAHLAIDDVNHTPKFWDTFKELLSITPMEYYIPTDYKENPVPYCGMVINK